MRKAFFSTTLQAALRFSVLALAFVCVVERRAEAQNCLFGCTVIYATQDTNQGISCFSLNASTCSSPNPLTSHVSFGLTVDFYQPTGQTFGAHTATSGACSPCTGNGFFDTSTMNNQQDYKVTFDGSSTAGGNLNAGTYNYFCTPHGVGMRGVLIVDPDGTSVSLSRTAGPNPSTFGQSVTFTATVNNSVLFSAVTPTGTVIFEDFGVPISAALTLISGSRSFTISTLAGGSHSITAVYTPADGNFTGSTSGALSHTVNAANTSTGLALTAGTNPTTVGQSLTFTASVSNTSGTGVVPAGTVTFEDNGTPISGAVPLDGGGSAVFPTSSLAGGTHPITAVFNANSNFNGSTSSVINEAVHDFSFSISNPVQSVLPSQTASFNGTISSLGGYASTITVSCGAGAPGTCNGASVPLAANAQNVPFTVSASNPSVANFSFSISGSGAESLTRSVPVTLSVGSFSFSQPTPSSVSVAQGNPSSTMSFQIASLGTFTGEVDLSCPSLPANVTCMFSNGASTQALVLSAGQVIDDTLVLNTSSSVLVNSYSIPVQATPIVAPGQFQTRTVTLNVTSQPAASLMLTFGNTNTVLIRGFCNGFLGFHPAGTCLFHSFPPPVFMGVGGVSEPGAVGVSNNFGMFTISAWNQEASQSSDTVQMDFFFDQPVAQLAGSIYFGTGGETCTTVSTTQVSCALGTIIAGHIKTVTVQMKPLFYRVLNLTVLLSESEANSNTNTQTQKVQVRPRPLVHNSIPPTKP